MGLRRTAIVLAGALLTLISVPAVAMAAGGSYPEKYPIIQIDKTVLPVGGSATVTVGQCLANSTATVAVVGPLSSPGVQKDSYTVNLDGTGFGTQQVIFSTVGRQTVSVTCTAPDGSGPITASLIVTTSAAAVAPVVDPGVLGLQQGAGVGAAATGTSLADLAHTGASLVGPLLLALGLLGGGTTLVLLSSRRRKTS